MQYLKIYEIQSSTNKKPRSAAHYFYRFGVWIYCTSAVNMSLLNWVGMLWLVDKNRMGPVRLTWFHVIVCLCGKLFTDDWECLHMLCFSWWHVTCIHITSVTLAMIGIDYQV